MWFIIVLPPTDISGSSSEDSPATRQHDLMKQNNFTKVIAWCKINITKLFEIVHVHLFEKQDA